MATINIEMPSSARTVHHVGIFGAGGFAREVLSFAARAASIRTLARRARIRWWLVDLQRGAMLNGVPVISEAEFLALDGPRHYTIAISDSRRREAIAARVGTSAAPLPLVASEALTMPSVEADEGWVVAPFTTVSANARIGRWFQANFYCYVAHDCVIGDFVTLAPHACCNGNVHLNDHVYVGAGAVIRNGSASEPLVVGAGAVIGMGAVVTRSVPAGETVVGVPASPLVRRGPPGNLGC
jgi:sugar O-acyltransferase (sialic acid O-acetyltransferase NeuD family)